MTVSMTWRRPSLIPKRAEQRPQRVPVIDRGLCGAILDVRGCGRFGTVRGAKEASAHLDSVADYLAVAVSAGRGNRLDGTFKAVECMSRSGCNDFETFVVLIAANFALRHMRWSSLVAAA